MNKTVNTLFVALGIAFVVLLIVYAAFFMVNAAMGRDVGFDPRTGAVEVEPMADAADDADAHPYLSPAQETALRVAGIDPASVPTHISAEQEACATAALGEERVAALKAGAAPTPQDYFSAKECF